MVELYTDLSNGVWRVIMEQNGGRGRVEFSRTGEIEKIDWHLGPEGTIRLNYPDTFEGFVPKYVLAKIAAMCKISYQWYSLQRRGIDYGHCTVSDEDIDSLVETHGFDFTEEQVAELKARKDELTEATVAIVMEVHWMAALGDATEELLYEEVSK